MGIAITEQRWDDVRRFLTETIAAPETPLPLKVQSQRALDDLNRRRPAKQ
jgi:hypothetical protein